MVLDRTLSLMDGAVVPWADSTSEYYYELLQSLAAHYKMDMKTPVRKLPKAFIEALLRAAAEGGVVGRPPGDAEHRRTDRPAHPAGAAVLRRSAGHRAGAADRPSDPQGDPRPPGLHGQRRP